MLNARFKEIYITTFCTCILWLMCGWFFADSSWILCLSSGLMAIMITVISANEIYLAGRESAFADVRLKAEEKKAEEK